MTNRVDRLLTISAASEIRIRFSSESAPKVINDRRIAKILYPIICRFFLEQDRHDLSSLHNHPNPLHVAHLVYL